MGNLNAAHNHKAAHSRIAQKRYAAERSAWTAAIQQTLAGLEPEYLAKLKHDCLRSANVRLRGASAEEVVREAARDLEGRLRFMTEGKRP
jgi:hypothetical protein